MAQDIALFGAGVSIAVPDYISQTFTETNIVERETTPSLTLKGKVWSITVGGETSPLMKVDDDGEQVPIPALQIVILDYAKERGRSYYEGSYDPDNVKAPDCWSHDSVTPDDTVAEPVSPKCAGCPMSVKGSRVADNGKATVACGQYRLLAVVPQKQLNMPPLRLRLAITSDYDGQSKDLMAQGKFAFSNFMDFVKGKGVMHSASLVARISFDPAVAYPKVIFQASRWLTEAENAKVAEIRANGTGITDILGVSHLVGDARKAALAALPKPEAAAKGGTSQADADKAAAEREKQRLAAEAEVERARKAEEARLAEEAEKARKAEAAKKKREEAAKKKADDERAAAAAAAGQTGGATEGPSAASLASAFGDGEDDGGTTETTAAKPAETAKVTAAAATKQVVEAKTAPGDVSPGLAGLLDSWSSDDD